MPTALRRPVAAMLGLLLALAGTLVASPSPATAQPAAQSANLATPDTVYYWNDVLLEAFRRQGGGPGPLARAAAMMHTGIYELVNANWWVGRASETGYRGYHLVGFFERSDLEDDDAGFVAAHLLRDALPDQAAFIEQAFEDLRRLGRFDSAERTDEQEEIAWFWANDLDGTYKPVGQLLHHTRLVTEQFGVNDPLGVGDTVAYSRLFALVSLALADGGIAAWDSKYDTGIDLWRPETAIQHADEDGNDNTVQDPAWMPLSADRPSIGAPRFSPCFPSWASGHATFAAAWAGVMRAEYGDALPEPTLLDSEDPRATDVERSYDSFTAIAEENAVSRLYLGVHYRFDATSGTTLGLDVGDHVQSSVLTELCRGCS